MAKSKKEPFVAIPLSILYREDLTATDKLIYGVILRYDGMPGAHGAFASLATMAREAGISRSSVKRAVRNLERLKLIKQIGHGYRGTARWEARPGSKRPGSI